MIRDEAPDDLSDHTALVVSAAAPALVIPRTDALHDLSDGELLSDLAGAADRRRAETTTASSTDGPAEDSSTGTSTDSSNRIADLEEALVSELRSRHPSM